MTIDVRDLETKAALLKVVALSRDAVHLVQDEIAQPLMRNVLLTGRLFHADQSLQLSSSSKASTSREPSSRRTTRTAQGMNADRRRIAPAESDSLHAGCVPETISRTTFRRSSKAGRQGRVIAHEYPEPGAEWPPGRRLALPGHASVHGRTGGIAREQETSRNRQDRSDGANRAAKPLARVFRSAGAATREPEVPAHGAGLAGSGRAVWRFNIST